MSSKYFATLTALILALLLFMPSVSRAQVIEATGTSQEASSQLIYYYNLLTGGDNYVQVTNTNDTEGVTIHVQIFRSYDIDAEGPTPPVICDERDFIDFLTPNDTHAYRLMVPNFFKNAGETEMLPGESTSIDLNSPVQTQGFVVITPVVSESDLSAISFQHMMGSTNMIGQVSFNAMGRKAVDFATGDIVPDGTPLDGTTNGLVLLQPTELIFNFEAVSPADIVGITFADSYGPPGLLGYRVDPGDSTWTTFIFDWKEDPTSCGTRPVACFTTVGLHDEINHYSTNINDNDLLCQGADTPEHPFPPISGFNIGWTRIFVSGLEDNENQLGITTFVSPFYDAKWMNTNK